MAQFHISADGNPRPCKAEKGNCPISGELEHFDSPEKAREYYEVIQGGAFTRKKYRSHEERISELPKVTGLRYESQRPTPDQVRGDGVPYSTVNAYRLDRAGREVPVAELVIYDDGEVRAYDNSYGALEDFDALENLSKVINDKYDVSPISSGTLYNPKSEETVSFETPLAKHNHRVSELPEIKGVVYGPQPFKDTDVTEEGVAYSSVDVFREGRTGKRSTVAEITVYENGDAIVWDKTTADAADIRTRDKLAKAIKEKYKISPYSSPVFRM